MCLLGNGWRSWGRTGLCKTTLLRMLFGRLQPTDGSIELDGTPLARIPPDARARKMAVVTQDEQPNHGLTTAEYVTLGRIPHHGRQNRGHPSWHR